MQTRSYWIPTGDNGTRMTVAEVANLIRRGAVNPMVRDRAALLVAGVSPRDRANQLRALRSWVASKWRFLRDPYGAELLHSADTLLRQNEARGYIQADCDDAAILSGALARSIGFKVQLVTVGFKPRGPYAHIWAEAWSPTEGRWVEFDVTRTSQDLDSKVVRQFNTPV